MDWPGMACIHAQPGVCLVFLQLVIVLTVVEGGMRRTVPDSQAWMC